MEGGWRYQNRKTYKISSMLSPEEYEEFQCDCRKVYYPTYVRNYILGMAIWVLKEDNIHPRLNMKQLIIKSRTQGPEMYQYLIPKHNFIEKSTQSYERGILSEARFNSFCSGFRDNEKMYNYMVEEHKIKKELERLRVVLHNKATWMSHIMTSKLLNRFVKGLYVN